MSHKTNDERILGCIDCDNKTQVTGWCIAKDFICRPLRVLFKNTNGDDKNTCNSIIPVLNERIDVFNFYQINTNEETIFKCGFLFEYHMSCELQMYYDNVWVSVFTFNKINMINVGINSSTPSYIVVDNFYSNPDEVREFALSCNFEANIAYHKGKRTASCYRFNGIKERFESLIGKKIINWEINKYPNGCFQTCIAGDQLVYHYDFQDYAGIIFLTPDAPVETGTSLFRSKITKTKKINMNNGDEIGVIFKNGFLDATQFELIDEIGNVYNRLLLFDAKNIHSASEYFGCNLENGRLFQMFFFDLEDEQ
jgi:hypothetical protein